MSDDLIGVSFLGRAVAGWPVLSERDKYCAFVGRARRGECFCVEADSVSCPLARFNLGIGITSVDELADTLVGWGDAADRRRGIQLLEDTTRMKRDFSHIAFFPAPLPEVEADLLLLVCEAEPAQFIARRHMAHKGQPMHSPIGSVGAACGECTAYVLEEERPVVSLGCGGSRPRIGLAPGEVLVAAPKGSLVYDMLLEQD